MFKRLCAAILKAAGYVLVIFIAIPLWMFLCAFFGIEHNGLIQAVLCFSLLVASIYLEDNNEQ